MRLDNGRSVSTDTLALLLRDRPPRNVRYATRAHASLTCKLPQAAEPRSLALHRCIACKFGQPIVAISGRDSATRSAGAPVQHRQLRTGFWQELPTYPPT